MVLFINVHVNQRVEVLVDGRIIRGIVKYKGCVNGVPGDWVGVQLDERVGKNDGMIKGRRYFSCPTGHGLFVPASKIRFIPSQRCLYNSYRTVEQDPELLLESELFTTEPPRPRSPYVYDIDEEYYDKARRADWEDRNYFKPERSFHLRHSVSNTLPASTWLRPETAMADYTYRSSPIHTEYRSSSPLRSGSYRPTSAFDRATSPVPREYRPITPLSSNYPAREFSKPSFIDDYYVDLYSRYNSSSSRALRPEMTSHEYRRRRSLTGGLYDDGVDEFDFISAPSIPSTYMPASAMLHQMDRGGWDEPGHVHYPRHWPVQTGRESVKWDKWNDVSY